jgi:hypothetical protein
MDGRALLAAAALLVAPAALAADAFVPHRFGVQGRMLAAGWEPAMPVPELYERMQGNESLAGASVEARFGVASSLSLGAALSWNRFSTPDAYAPAARLQAFSGRATVHYYPWTTRVQPYVGLGAGGLKWSHRVEGLVDESDYGWCVDPQVGVLITVDYGFALNVLARYEITTASLAAVPGYAALSRPSWVGLSVGLALY